MFKKGQEVKCINNERISRDILAEDKIYIIREAIIEEDLELVMLQDVRGAEWFLATRFKEVKEKELDNEVDRDRDKDRDFPPSIYESLMTYDQRGEGSI